MERRQEARKRQESVPSIPDVGLNAPPGVTGTTESGTKGGRDYGVVGERLRRIGTSDARGGSRGTQASNGVRILPCREQYQAVYVS